LLFFTTSIEELNFWGEILLRKLSTTSNDGKLNFIISVVPSTWKTVKFSQVYH